MRGLVVVHVSRCVLMTSCTRTTIWISGLYTGRVFLIMEAGIITSGFGRINSHLSVITHHGNSSTVAFFPGLDERLKETRWNTFTLWHDFPASVSLSPSSISLHLSYSPSHPPLFLWLSYALSLSLPNPDISLPLLSSSYLFPSNWTDMPLFSAPWICRCNPRFFFLWNNLYRSLSYSHQLQTNDPIHKHVVNLDFQHEHV